MGEYTLPSDYKPEIHVVVNPEEKTLKFIDNGLGMTADEVEEYINQIAFSGATDFIEKLSWGLAVFMVVISIAAAYVLPSATHGTSVIMEQAKKEQATNPYNMPAAAAAHHNESTAAPAASNEAPAPPVEAPAEGNAQN